MVACVIALVVLAVMGIFSARYRKWAREAFDCVARRVTLRPCRTGFDEKVRAVVTGSLMKRHVGLARFVHKKFELLAWVFTIITLVSLVYSAYSLYNLAVLGTCDPSNPESCPFGAAQHPLTGVCTCEDGSVCNSDVLAAYALPCDSDCTGGCDTGQCTT